MSAPVMPSLLFWRRGRNFSAQQRSWCTALTPTARCAWLKSYGAREDKPIIFPLIFWKSASETSGHGEGAKSEGQRAKTFDLLCTLPSAFCAFGGQGRNRIADASLFRPPTVSR